MTGQIVCLDRCSGEQFEVEDGDDSVVAEAIEAYVREGIDSDTGMSIMASMLRMAVFLKALCRQPEYNEPGWRLAEVELYRCRIHPDAWWELLRGRIMAAAE